MWIYSFSFFFSSTRPIFSSILPIFSSRSSRATRKTVLTSIFNSCFMKSTSQSNCPNCFSLLLVYISCVFEYFVIFSLKINIPIIDFSSNFKIVKPKEIYSGICCTNCPDYRKLIFVEKFPLVRFL